MLHRLLGGAAAALLAFQTPLFAQIPGVPSTTAIPGATTAIPGAATVPTAAPAAPNNIWSKICMTPEQKQACKQKLCSMQIFQFFNGALAPMSALTGGLIGGCCPGPNDANPADLAKPADSAEGAAARIKKLEAEAAARRAAVRYLGTVDCSRFPEAEAALIASLRGDENECVRYEAALALGGGCCCTKRVLQALVVVVSGRKTNEPAEHSLRVRMAAAKSLERCLMKYCEQDVLLPATNPMEKPMGAPTAPAKEKASADPLVIEGKQILTAFKMRYLAAPPTIEPPVAAPPVTQVVAQLQSARLVPAPAPAPVPTFLPRSTNPPPSEEQARSLPPTGRRDVWSVLQHTLRDR